MHPVLALETDAGKDRFDQELKLIRSELEAAEFDAAGEFDLLEF